MCPNYDAPELISVKIGIKVQPLLHLLTYILITKWYWKLRPGRWKFDSSKMIGNHWWPQCWAVWLSWPMRDLRAPSIDQSEARCWAWQESSCWSLCSGRYSPSARRPNFQTKGDHTQHTPHVRITWDSRFVSVYFMIMKLNLFMAWKEWSVKIIKSN